MNKTCFPITSQKNYRLKITCLAFLCCLSSFLFAQKGGALCSSVTQKIDDKPYCYKGPALDSVEVFAFIPGTTDTIRGISDSTGDVRIKPVPPGIYTVRAKFPGYAPAEYQGVIVAEMKNTYMCIEMIPVTAPDKKSKKRNRKK
jgi:hypothetical protein